MEEGTEVDVPGNEIGLIVGQPAQFRFFSSSTRHHDRPGEVLSAWTPDELAETDSLETVLPADETIEDTSVPVRFQSRITELGVLELWCVSTQSTSAGSWNSACAKKIICGTPIVPSPVRRYSKDTACQHSPTR